MDKMQPMTDMALDPDEQDEMRSALPSVPKYPYGLKITLTEAEIEKLGLDISDWEVGNVYHLFALAKVTDIHKSESENGKDCCVSLQITHLAGESEDAENEEEADEGEEKPEEEVKPKRPKKNMYF